MIDTSTRILIATHSIQTLELKPLRFLPQLLNLSIICVQLQLRNKELLPKHICLRV